MTGSYVGTELTLFEHAVVWKRYVRKALAPWLRGGVMEIGAGLGATTQGLMHDGVEHWLCVEPDAELAMRIAERPFPVQPEVLVGTIADVPPERLFDCVLYVDVLEHIEDDRGEVARAAAHLRPGGHLVVLGPAYQALFSQFDEAVGHFRRYTKASLDALAPPGCVPESAFHMDAVGTLLSIGNRLLFRAKEPSRFAILIWDRIAVRVSRYFADPLTGRRFGRSVVTVWRRDESP